MTDDLDVAFSREPEIEPSPLFARSVMAAVRRAAAEPPPIPFPWARALPGIAVAAVLAVLAVANALSMGSAAPASPLPAAIEGLLRAASTPQAIWTMVGLLVSVASVAIARLQLER